MALKEVTPRNHAKKMHQIELMIHEMTGTDKNRGLPSQHTGPILDAKLGKRQLRA
jgi:hypothetical protein